MYIKSILSTLFFHPVSLVYPVKNQSAYFLLIAVLLCQMLTSCGFSRAEDFQEEGQRIASELTLELKQIKNRNQLLAAQEALTRKFEELVDLMIQVRRWQLKRPTSIPLVKNESINIELQAALI